jgi:signal transduction histidine kinase
MTGLSPFGNGRDERDHGHLTVLALAVDRLGQPGTSAIAMAAIAAACLLATLFTVPGGGSTGTVELVLTVVTCGALAIAGLGCLSAWVARRQVDKQVRLVRHVAQRGDAELRQMIERLMCGEQPAPLVPAPVQAAGDDQFLLLTAELERSHYLAAQAVLRTAGKVFGGRADQRVEIFVNLARRMQSLVHREIELLDELEAKVEDPGLLKDLFAVDHLATRLRRQTESLAVLGGSASRRQWTRQVTMHEVLRAGVAEVEYYSRVKVVPPIEGVLRGAAVADVIHLIAELVENATKFSPPSSTVLLCAQPAVAGVAIEIEDRGLGMLPSDQQRLNDLLADPERVDVDELLRDGRIGLYVVAVLARAHGIQARLKNNIYGGTQATVMLPKSLLQQATADSVPPHAAGPADEWRPRLTLVPPAADTASAQPPAVPGQRPPLPRRTAPASDLPQARDRQLTENGDDPAARHAEAPGHLTGLMADFLRGFGSAEEDDSPARD